MPEKVEITCSCGHVWISGAKPENRKCPKCGLMEDLVIGETIENEPEQKPQLTPKQEKAAARQKLLKARLSGVMAAQYPMSKRRSWKIELQQIAAGTWKGPIRERVGNKTYESIVG